MGETIDKVLVEYQNKCPIHNIPYSGVCIEKDCYETGIVCSKCNPKTCIETLGHQKISTDEFFNKYIKKIIQIVDFKALNELITWGSEVQQKQLDLQAQVFEEWEKKMIEEKFNKFKEKINQKIKNFTDKLIHKIQLIYEDFSKSKEDLKKINVEIPDFKLDSALDFLNKNKENKEELEKYLGSIKKLMDDNSMLKTQNDFRTFKII